jgi:hypothetical protein
LLKSTDHTSEYRMRAAPPLPVPDERRRCSMAKGNAKSLFVDERPSDDGPVVAA